MATRITDRAVIVADVTIRQNQCRVTAYADYWVGQRVRSSYPNRYWITFRMPGASKPRTISTTRQALFDDWMASIRANGEPVAAA